MKKQNPLLKIERKAAFIFNQKSIGTEFSFTDPTTATATTHPTVSLTCVSVTCPTK